MKGTSLFFCNLLAFGNILFDAYRCLLDENME